MVWAYIMHQLKDLGSRICIIGPSCSGKSTLARNISESINVKAWHLDQIAHRENTNWQRRSNDDLMSCHNQIIKDEKWIIDGNYSICMVERFKRASSVIWLDLPFAGCLLRYIKRSLINNPNRPGNLSGTQQQFNFSLIKYRLQNYPKNREKYRLMLTDFDGPFIRITTISKLEEYYRLWELSK